MKGDKYHLVELPMGWMALLAGEIGLKRASLKPSPQEAIEDLGSDLEGAEEDPQAFSEIVSSLGQYADGDMAALDEIQICCPPSELVPDMPLVFGMGPLLKTHWSWLSTMAKNSPSITLLS